MRNVFQVIILLDMEQSVPPEENCYNGDKDLGICIECKDNYYLDFNDGKCKSNQENNEF